MNTTANIQALTEAVLDETIDNYTFLSLLNLAKDFREGMRPFCFLHKLNDSNTSSTAAITLPTDFREIKKVMVGDQTVYEIPFDQQHLYRQSSGKFYIDHSAGTLNLLNPTTGKTVYIYYLKTTPEITAEVTPVWPARFWPILAFDVAEIQKSGIDADSEFARMAVSNNKTAQALWMAFILWDQQQQIKAQGGRVGVQDSEPSLDLSTM